MKHPFRAICVIIIVFAATVAVPLGSPIETPVSATPSELYEYYAYIPHTTNMSYWEPHVAHVDVVGINDSTHVSVYDISAIPNLLAEFNVNRMELVQYNLSLRYTLLENQELVQGRVTTVLYEILQPTYIKVVSDKLVAVCIGGGVDYYNGGVSAYYPSTDGGFAGREFVFMTVPTGERGVTVSVPRTNLIDKVFAIEDSEVTVYDASGKVVNRKTLPANTSWRLDLASRTVYQVVSTGRIVIGKSAIYGGTVVPAIEGGFTGRRFLESTMQGQLLGGIAFIAVSQGDPCSVKLYDMESGDLAYEKQMDSYEYWYQLMDKDKYEAKPVRVESSGDLWLYVGSWVPTYKWPGTPPEEPATPTDGAIWAMVDDVSQFAVAANKETAFYAVSSAVLFASEDAEVMLNEESLTLRKDDYLPIPKGLNVVKANVSTVIETIAMVGSSSSSWATYLVTGISAELAYPLPKTSTGETIGSPDLALLIAAAASVAVVVVGVLLLVTRRRSPKKSA